MSIERDHDLMQCLRERALGPESLIAIGGEACVFRLDAHRILRVNHAGFDPDAVLARAALLDELHGLGALPFAIPQVESVDLHGPRCWTIERYLPGRTLQAALKDGSTPDRERLLVATLEAAEALARLPLRRDTFGPLYWLPELRRPSWRAFLEARAAWSLAQARGLPPLSAAELAAPFPEPARPGFVHFDLYPGNLLTTGARVSAVLDFGGVACFGDPRFDTLSVAIYLRGEMTEGAQPRDHAVVLDWLRARDLADWLPDAERWFCAFWAFAMDDVRVARWVRRVLKA